MNPILENNVKISVNLNSKSRNIVEKLKCRNKQNGKLTELDTVDKSVCIE